MTETMPEEQRLQLRVAELEDELVIALRETEMYKGYWRELVDRDRAHGEKILKLTAALARIGLGLERVP